jgi:hypothetical protein
MDITTIYWLTILPNISSLATTLGIIAAFTGAFCLIIGSAEKRKDVRNCGFALVAVFVTLVTIGTLIPNREQMMFIAGSYFVTNVEGIKDLPPNIVAAANAALEELAKKGK